MFIKVNCILLSCTLILRCNLVSKERNMSNHDTLCLEHAKEITGCKVFKLNPILLIVRKYQSTTLAITYYAYFHFKRVLLVVAHDRCVFSDQKVVYIGKLELAGARKHHWCQPLHMSFTSSSLIWHKPTLQLP